MSILWCWLLHWDGRKIVGDVPRTWKCDHYTKVGSESIWHCFICHRTWKD